MTTTKMLQILIDGQSTLRKEIVKGQESLKKEVEEGFMRVNKRLDLIGKSVAFLEDDTPTREEHDGLEKRVSKIEAKLQFT